MSMTAIEAPAKSFEFCDMLDEQVVLYARRGSGPATEYLLNKYRDFVEGKARSFFLVGADHDDIVQEGMIGLFKAIRDFRHDKLSQFRSFAELCVTRQIITAIKTATRQKHVPLNSYVSLNAPVYDEDSDKTLLDIMKETKVTDPESVLMDRQASKEIISRIRQELSDLECTALRYHVQGRSYHEIAYELNREVKSIDNALQRAKRKLARAIGLAFKERRCFASSGRIPS